MEETAITYKPSAAGENSLASTKISVRWKIRVKGDMPYTPRENLSNSFIAVRSHRNGGRNGHKIYEKRQRAAFSATKPITRAHTSRMKKLRITVSRTPAMPPP